MNEIIERKIYNILQNVFLLCPTVVFFTNFRWSNHVFRRIWVFHMHLKLFICLFLYQLIIGKLNLFLSVLICYSFCIPDPVKNYFHPPSH